MRHRPIVIGLLLIPILVLLAGRPTDRRPNRRRRWWVRVRADIERFERPIYDRRAESDPGEKPIVKRGRVFCPHRDGSPLKARVIRRSPVGATDAMTVTAYYCEIEGVYWVHVVGGIAGLNLVTGPFVVGRPAPTTRPTTVPATRPAAGDLAVALERGGDRLLRAGKPVAVVLVLTNTGRRAIWVNTNLALAQIVFQVRGPRVDIRPTGVPERVPAPQRGDFLRIKPGASHRIALADLATGRYRYRLAADGAYVVRVTYTNRHDGSSVGVSAWTGSVTSKGLLVRVAGQAR